MEEEVKICAEKAEYISVCHNNCFPKVTRIPDYYVG